jgi:hypothetical protein
VIADSPGHPISIGLLQLMQHRAFGGT